MNKTTIYTALIVTGLLLNTYSYLPAISYDDPTAPGVNVNVSQRIETKPGDIPHFDSPVCLLVGLNNSQLAYREISVLSGFELFSVPYRSDIKTLVEQMKPVQIIIKHPSGFVGLYSVDGQLIRGVETVYSNAIASSPQGVPESIVQPSFANTPYESLYYPGSVTGGIPHGGLSYRRPPQGRNITRHLLKLASVAGLVPWQYPGYFKAFVTNEKEKLFPALLLPQLPLGIAAVSTYADSRLDEAAYEEARTQPRDYMFQPIIEGY